MKNAPITIVYRVDVFSPLLILSLVLLLQNHVDSFTRVPSLATERAHFHQHQRQRLYSSGSALPSTPSTTTIPYLRSNYHRSLTSVVVVNAGPAAGADTPTNSTNTANPKLRGTRRRNFGQKQRTWMQSYEALLEFKRLKQHCRVPKIYDLDRPLGTWVSNLRRKGRAELSSEQLKLLDEAGFDWETRAERENRLWQEKYQKLIEYKEVYGDCCVPQKYKEDRKLGKWVADQRQLRKEGRLRVDREEQLDAIGFTWSLKNRPEHTTNTHNENMWNEKYDRLLEFRGKWGHCLVPHFFEEDTSLATWVKNQRVMFKRGQLRPDRKDRLEEINFEFDPSNADENLEGLHWNSMFQHLKDYKAEHGDTNVKKTHEEFGLGLWVMTQRTNRSMMDEQRKQQLDDIGFQWTRYSFSWEDRFEELREHSKLHGSCRVKKKENPGLANWVFMQRYMIKRGKLSEAKIKKLVSVCFV